MVKVQGVRKAFGENKVLRGIDMTVQDGEVVTILGPSGSGKTTLLRCINFLEKPDEGTITVGDMTVDARHATKHQKLAIRRKTAMVFQLYNLFKNKTALENVAEGLVVVQNLEKQQAHDKARAMLEQVGLGDKLSAYPSELSGGQQQRVDIARTLAPGPKVLFMDEPLSNLDAKLRLEMRSELQRLHLNTGSTFIYVTHDQLEAMTLATKICLMDNGVLQQYDEPMTLYNRPGNLFAADFVGNPAINFIEASGRQQPDGTLSLSLLGGLQASFHPLDGIDIAKWYDLVNQEEKDRRAAEDAVRKDAKGVEKGNKDTAFKYRVAKVDEDAFESDAPVTEEDFVLGVRPEFLRIREDGAMEAEVFSAMPTGMETTVRLRIGRYLLTGVVFGGVLYKIGQKIRLDFLEGNILLFSRKNGLAIAQGTLHIL